MFYSILGLIHLVLFIIAAFEIVTSSKPLLHKVLWLVLIFVLPIIGLLIYFFMGRRR